MKHIRNRYLKILNQDKSIITISISNILNKYINEVQKKWLSQNPRSRQINHHNQHINVSNEYNVRACVQ